MTRDLRTFNGEQIDMFWVTRESGTDGYKYIEENNNAFGKYAFTVQYTLVPFMKHCLSIDKEKYKDFEKYTLLPIEEILNDNNELRTLWLNYCDTYREEFYSLQDDFSYNYHYLAAKENCSKRGINIDNYSPVLKGSLWSFVVRSGVSVGSKKLINAYKKGATDELPLLKKAYGAYGNSDSNRWSISSKFSQYTDALEIYRSIQSINNVEDKNIIKEESVIEQEKDSPVIGEDIDPFVKEDEKETNEPNIEEEFIIEESSNTEKYFVCEGWNTGYPTNKVGEFTDYDKAKTYCAEYAVQSKRVYYVYSEKGIRLFINNPNSAKKDIINGYKIGTGYFNGLVVNEKGAFTKYSNAINYADLISKKDQVSYKVYLNGVLQYTASTK